MNASSLNFGENFTETAVKTAENPQSEEISSKIPSETFKFREIILPTNEPPTIKISEPEKISPQNLPQNSSQPVELPQIPAIISPNEPSTIEIPKPQKFESPTIKTSSGLIKTEFFFNGAPYDQFDLRERMSITREQWRQSNVRLKITNDTGKIWAKPTIKYKLGQNWGGGVTKTITLPDLADGNSAEFEIPFDFEVSDRKNTNSYIQIYFIGDEKKLDENYWCIWFNIID